MNNAIERHVKDLEAELRALKCQNLVTDPKDAVVATSVNAHVGGIPANDLNRDHNALIEFVPDDETSTVPPVINIWLRNIHVPGNDYGINEGYLTPVRYNPTSYYVRCPFIAYNTTDTYSMDVHCSALVPGRLLVSGD